MSTLLAWRARAAACIRAFRPSLIFQVAMVQCPGVPTHFPSSVPVDVPVFVPVGAPFVVPLVRGLLFLLPVPLAYAPYAFFAGVSPRLPRAAPSFVPVGVGVPASVPFVVVVPLGVALLSALPLGPFAYAPYAALGGASPPAPRAAPVVPVVVPVLVPVVVVPSGVAPVSGLPVVPFAFAPHASFAGVSLPPLRATPSVVPVVVPASVPASVPVAVPVAVPVGVTLVSAFLLSPLAYAPYASLGGVSPPTPRAAPAGWWTSRREIIGVH